jgi:hypothetical protein
MRLADRLTCNVEQGPASKQGMHSRWGLQASAQIIYTTYEKLSITVNNLLFFKKKNAK